VEGHVPHFSAEGKKPRLALFRENFGKRATVISLDRAFDGVFGAVKKQRDFCERRLNETQVFELRPVDFDALSPSLAHFQIPLLC
jgi:hypothetical protein